MNGLRESSTLPSDSRRNAARTGRNPASCGAHATPTRPVGRPRKRHSYPGGPFHPGGRCTRSRNRSAFARHGRAHPGTGFGYGRVHAGPEELMPGAISDLRSRAAWEAAAGQGPAPRLLARGSIQETLKRFRDRLGGTRAVQSPDVCVGIVRLDQVHVPGRVLQMPVGNLPQPVTSASRIRLVRFSRFRPARPARSRGSPLLGR